jgi:flagellin
MNVVAHNLFAMNSNRMLGINSKNKAKSMEKLSSGYKINKGADDAAGLSISEKMRRQIRGLSKGVENTQDGVSLCQVADGALAEVNDMLHRITELSVKSANGTNSEADRQAIQEEINGLLREIDRIGDTTKFNERKIFSDNNTKYDDFETKYIPPTISSLSVRGTPTDTVAMTYKISADENGFSINNDNFTWNEFSNGINTLAESPIAQGTYNFDYRGFTLSLSANENATLDDLIKRTDGASFSTNVGYSYKTTAIGGELSWNELDKTVNIGTYSNLPSNGKLTLYVDNNRQIWLQKDDGSNITGYNLAKVSITKENYHAGDREFLRITDGGNGFSGPWIYIEFTEDTTKEEYLDMVNGATISFDVDSVRYNNTLGKYFFKATEIELSPAKVKTSDLALSSINQTAYKGIPIDEDILSNIPHQNIWIQSGCDSGDGLYLEIDKMNTDILGIDDIDVSTEEGANNALKIIDNALEKVSSNRSKIGAQQNRLEHIIVNEENIIENTTSAESRIRDADMADEMVKFSNINILEQVSQSMLAQANQSQQGVLNLLR